MSLPVSDVRTWIGNAEVSTEIELTLETATVQDETTSSVIAVESLGPIAGGSNEAMGAFLQTGTISFRVGGGEPNVLRVAQSRSEVKMAAAEVNGG